MSNIFKFPDKKDWKSIGKGALIAGAGALIVIITAISGLDWGVTGTAIVTAIAGVLVNAIRKWLTNTNP